MSAHIETRGNTPEQVQDIEKWGGMPLRTKVGNLECHVGVHSK